MHILYVHQNFPAQFGHVAQYLAQVMGWRCTFVTQVPPGRSGGVERVQYKVDGGAATANHFCSRTFENGVWHCDGVYKALLARPDIRPDLIVGHSGFGSTLFLRELYPDVPVINLFEYYYRPHDQQCDMTFRKDLGWPIPAENYLRARCRNAMMLLDLQNCDAAYTPTEFQRSRFPDEYTEKLQVIFDGVDRTVYHGHGEQLRPAPQQRGTRRVAGIDVPASTRVVTYVSRGFESIRGFDVFMRAAKRIYEQHPDVLFLVAGADRVVYGGDTQYIAPAKTFKEWVLLREEFDLSKFRFLGVVNPVELGRLMAASDLHVYLTAPFVLSWSMMDAMSCGAVVLGSDTAPVREMIRDGHNGLLADFFDADEIASKALRVLKDPAAYRPLGRAAEEMVARRYSLEAVFPRMLELYEDALEQRGPAPVAEAA
jgi:glycosyltransferase involved in cell wall biosynthesis